MKKAIKIWLNRAEGPTSQCGAITFEGERCWELAQKQLEHWGKSAPEKGNGYDKCDFRVVYEKNEDGESEEYAGRFDLQKGGLESDGSNLVEHIRREMLYHSNQLRPSHFNDSTWEFVKAQNINDGYVEYCTKFLQEYELPA